MHAIYRYIFQARSADCLYREALRTPLIHLEDVYLTGILARSCGISRKLDQRFHPNEWFQCRINATNFVLVHYKRGARKERLFARLAGLSNTKDRVAGIVHHNCKEGEELW